MIFGALPTARPVAHREEQSCAVEAEVAESAASGYVALHLCLVCERTRSQRAIYACLAPRHGQKVSDEFTLPLCAIHHHQARAIKRRDRPRRASVDRLSSRTSGDRRNAGGGIAAAAASAITSKLPGKRPGCEGILQDRGIQRTWTKLFVWLKICVRQGQ